MITQQIKEQILNSVQTERVCYKSETAHAVALGIPVSVYRQLSEGQIPDGLQESIWIQLARRSNISLEVPIDWKVVKTPT
ncbi:MAG: ATP-binding protein, partial [Bacteroides sp.]|nr:ATP-binding protein [Bacteroides sp.]